LDSSYHPGMIQRYLLAGVAVAAGTLVLVGCGAATVTAPKRSGAVAAQLLSTANTSAFATSFEATFKGGLNMSLAGVTGLSAATQQQLTKLQAELNSGAIQGTIDFQSPTEFRITYTAPGLLPGPLQLVEVGGSGYASWNGTQWYRAGSVPAGASPILPSSLSNLPAELKSLGTLAKGQVTVTNSGPSSRDGVEVDHLHAVVSGSGLDKIFGAALGAFGSGSTPPAGASITGLAQLLQFSPASGDVYIATQTNLPQEESFSGGVALNLGVLGLLSSSPTPAPHGDLGLTASFAVSYSRYGASFAISKPTAVLPGQLPLPSSVSQLP